MGLEGTSIKLWIFLNIDISHFQMSFGGPGSTGTQRRHGAKSRGASAVLGPG